MNQQNYSKERRDILKAFGRPLANRKDENVNAQFAMTSASLLNYLPVIPFERHEEIFKSILLYKKLNIAEQSSFEILNIVETENLNKEILSLLQNKPCVICTFHTGSYRIINLFLIKHKIPFSLVMGKKVMEKEGANFSTLYDQCPETKHSGALTILNAEAPQAGLQMLRELKRGKSLVLYIDGNSGAGDATMKNENHCCVEFLNQEIYARKGIGWLAHAAGTAIIPLASYRPDQDTIRLRFFDPIYPTGKDRNAFAQQTTQRIYDHAAPLISENPEQWETWLYIHKVAHIINRKPAHNKNGYTMDGDIQFNSPAFGIFKINNTPFLLQKNDYSFYEIDEALYGLLTMNAVQPLRNENFDKGYLEKLFKQGVLITK